MSILCPGDKAPISGAVFSPCMRYRYGLWRPARNEDGERGRVLFVMLNPSTADAEEDDPTIRRCVGFASRWGFRQLLVANVFAYRSTDPKVLRGVSEAIGPDNDHAIHTLARMAELVVCAWGTHGKLRCRDDQVVRIIRQAGEDPHHLGLTKAGHPRHPLYLRRDEAPRRWSEACDRNPEGQP